MVPSRDERGSLRTQTYFLLSLVAAEPVTAGNTSAFPGYERGHWSLCLQHLPDADVISWKSWIQGRPGEGWQHTNNNKDQKKTCYLSWHWGSGLALYRAKPKQFTDFWRQFLTFIPGVPHNISGRKCDTKCELTPQSYVPSVTQPSTNGFAVQEYCTIWQRAGCNSCLFQLAVALYSEVADCFAQRSQDFKMMKSLMLCVVALAFLSLGSSKHMVFKDCGKFAFLLRFLAIFVPVKGYYDHVTPCTRIVPRGLVTESRRVEVIVISLLVVKAQKICEKQKSVSKFTTNTFL